MGAIDPGSMLGALRRLAALLSQWSGGAAVVGGVGIVARVRPRFTADIDVVIAVEPSRVTELLALAGGHGWTHDPSELDELLEGGLARLRAADGPGVALDLMFVDSAFLESVVERATPVGIGDASIPVASVEDLLLMKLEAERPQDIDDILAIKDAHSGTLDIDYIRRQAAILGLADRLELHFGDTVSR